MLIALEHIDDELIVFLQLGNQGHQRRGQGPNARNAKESSQHNGAVAVGVLIDGPWRLDPVVAQGCRPIGPGEPPVFR